MSEERIDAKKLPISKAISLFMDGKISKDNLKDAFDKRSLFKLNSRQLEDVLYMQKKDPSSFPKKLIIKSSDILYEYGRNLSAGQLMNLASKGYVSEKDVLKALKKNTVITMLATISEKEQKSDKKEDSEDKKKNDEEKQKSGDRDDSSNEKTEEPEVRTENVQVDSQKESEVENEQKEFSQKDLVDKETVKSFFSADRLIKMFFAKKMTNEFTEAYEDAFKDDREFTSSRSKDMIKELQEIFEDNLQALFIVVMRLYFKGMVFEHDVEDAIKAEFFTEKTFDASEEYDVLDKDGNIIYSYKKPKKERTERESDEVVMLALESASEVSDSSAVIPVVDIDEDAEVNIFNYSIMEPLTKDEIIEAYRDSKINGELFKRIFTMTELLQMYKHKKISIKVFSLFDENKRKNEILKLYKEGFIHLEDIMELFFYYDGISAKELKSIINEMPKKVAIVRYITIDTGFKKIFELYKNKLIDFNTLCLLKYQNYISEEEFEQIRLLVNKEDFYEDINSRVFYTYKNDDIHIEDNLEDKETSLELEDVPVEVSETQDKPEIADEKDEIQDDSEIVDEEDEIQDDSEIVDEEDEIQDDSEIVDEEDEVQDKSEIINKEKVDVIAEENIEKPVVEISDSERILLTKVLGISEEEIKNISLIDSKDMNGQPTSLDGYQIISDIQDGLVIFGKFDYISPIFVMTYEEAAYFLRSRDDKDECYIFDDLIFVQRLENNEQVCVVEHDENMGKAIVQALCDLSEIARCRYIDDEQYMREVSEYIRTIDESYIEMIKESNNNM